MGLVSLPSGDGRVHPQIRGEGAAKRDKIIVGTHRDREVLCRCII